MGHTTQYLYDIEATVLRTMGYEQALEFKLMSAKDLYYKLIMERADADDERKHYVWKAMTHTQNLLDELRES